MISSAVEPARRFSHTSAVVAISFVSLLALGAVVSLLTISTIDSFRDSVRAVDEQQRSVETSIQTLRSQIYVSSIVLRDYLLDPVAERLPGYRAQLGENRRGALAGVDGIRLRSSLHNSAAADALVREIRAFWASVDEVLKLTREERATAGFVYLQKNVIPKREGAIALAEELADLVSAESTTARRSVEQARAHFRARMVIIRVVTTAFAILIGLLCTWRVYNLEKSAAKEQLGRERAEQDSRRLAQQVVRAQEEERRSVSRELHDELGQMVTALRIRLANLQAHNPRPTRKFEDTIRESRTLVEQTIESIRRIAMGLRPAMLDDLGMAAAIQWQAREFSRRFDIPVTVSIEPELSDLPEPERTHLYRIVQEALTNCARHARPTSVQIDFRSVDGMTSLKISDDGVGIPNGDGASRGFGLAGITERVRELGGSIAIESAEGRGTTLVVTVPIAETVANA